MRVIFLAFLLFVYLIPSSVYCQKEMSMPTYRHLMANEESRIDSLAHVTQQLDSLIGKLHQTIKATDSLTKKVWEEIYQLIESDEAGVRTFLAGLDRLKLRVEEVAQDLNIRTYDLLTVNAGETLESIAADSAVYGNKEQWRRLFSFNAEMLHHQPAVKTGMILKIHRKLEKTEYLTKRKETLHSVSENAPFGTAWEIIRRHNQGIMDYFKINGPEEELPPYLILKVHR